jgi:sulfate adenylyltransferase subunit 2 (EC 2.7.7.4)
MSAVTTRRLSAHLQRLEAEAIGILRETAASFRNPVLLYSIGKDSSVVLHIAMKAFAPGKPPFPLLHIATGWDFRDMLEFRDRRVAELGLRLIVHTNPEGLARGINPITHGSQVHMSVMGTEALKQRSTCTSSTRRSAAPGATRRSLGRRSACSRSARPAMCGSRAGSGRNSGASTTRD